MKTEEEIRKAIRNLEDYAKHCLEHKQYENVLCANKKIQALKWVLEEK